MKKRYVGPCTQCAEWILNKIAKAINKTFTGLKFMLQGLRVCFVLSAGRDLRVTYIEEAYSLVRVLSPASDFETTSKYR